jgi:hypothetical protein
VATRFALLTIIQVMKDDEMGRACGMYGKKINTYRVLVGKLVNRDHLQDLGIDGKVILKRVLKESKLGGGGA